MKTRIALWDNIRFFLITAVVVGHFADDFTNVSNVCKSIFLFIYAFHMPLFIFISGHLHKNRQILEKCFFFISIGFLFKIILTISYTIIGHRPPFSLLSDSGMPWFLFAMAAYILITYALRERNKWFVLFLSVIVACFAGYDNSVGDYLYLARILVFFPFYWLGTMIKLDTILQLKKKKSVIAFSIATILGWAAMCFLYLDKLYILRYLFTGRNPYWDEILTFGPFYRFGTYVLAFVLSFSIIMIFPSNNIKGISRMGTHSIDVYIWHGPLCLISNHFIHYTALFSFGLFGKISYFLLAILLSILLSQGSIISYPIEMVRKYCYEKNEQKQTF